MSVQHVAVIDVGKTNIKLALVDLASQRELAVLTAPNRVDNQGPYPCFDLEAHWAFFLRGLKSVHQRYRIDGISVTTHGAAAVLLNRQGALATPMLDYEHDGPAQTAHAYDQLRPEFALTGSPRLPQGLNLGAQLHWLFQRDSALHRRCAQILTYPQYWGYRLTGAFATDITSLGCHTDLWLAKQGRFSALRQQLALEEKLPSPSPCGAVLSALRSDVVQATGLSPSTPVLCGLHDSNASLLPHLLQRSGPFCLLSTGTWVVAMAIRGDDVELDPRRDTLINVNALAQPVPSARFMGGREFERLCRQVPYVPPTEHDQQAVLTQGVMLLPSVVEQSGPFPLAKARWTRKPATAGQRGYAVSLYLALMSESCLRLIGARGPCVLEGPLANNEAFLAMLAAVHPEAVEIAESETGTSLGAALLFHSVSSVAERRLTRVLPQPAQAGLLRDYAARWRALAAGHSAASERV